MKKIIIYVLVAFLVVTCVTVISTSYRDSYVPGIGSDASTDRLPDTSGVDSDTDPAPGTDASPGTDTSDLEPSDSEPSDSEPEDIVPEGYNLKGVWMIDKEYMMPEMSRIENINFTSNNIPYTSFGINYDGIDLFISYNDQLVFYNSGDNYFSYEERFLDFGGEYQAVSQEFYDAFTSIATYCPDGVALKGEWKINDGFNYSPSVSQSISFTSNGNSFDLFEFALSTDSIYYVNERYSTSDLVYDLSFQAEDPPYWAAPEYRYVDFGEDAQFVSFEFYYEFVKNAFPVI